MSTRPACSCRGLLAGVFLSQPPLPAVEIGALGFQEASAGAPLTPSRLLTAAGAPHGALPDKLSLSQVQFKKSTRVPVTLLSTRCITTQKSAPLLRKFLLL